MREHRTRPSLRPEGHQRNSSTGSFSTDNVSDSDISGTDHPAIESTDAFFLVSSGEIGGLSTTTASDSGPSSASTSPEKASDRKLLLSSTSALFSSHSSEAKEANDMKPCSLPASVSPMQAAVADEERMESPSSRFRAATTGSPAMLDRRKLSASMLKASGERFIAIRSGKEAIIVKNATPSRLRKESMDSSERSSSSGRTRRGSRDPASAGETSEDGVASNGEGSGAAGWNEPDEASAESEEEEDDDDDDGDEEDDDFLLDSNAEITLELAIKAQRLGAIAALLRKIEGGQTERAVISALTGADAVEHGGPGGTPLHFAASLPPTYKKRDKVFEYLLNYSVKHRQRKEDEEEGLPDPLDHDISFGRAINRKRKQSYLQTDRPLFNTFVVEERSGQQRMVVHDSSGLIPAWQWLDAPNHDGNTALHVAASKGYLFAVNILLQDGQVDPDLPNIQGTSAVYHAVVLRVVTDAPSPIKGRTALHVACRLGLTDVCVALLAAGATLDRLDDKVRKLVHLFPQQKLNRSYAALIRARLRTTWRSSTATARAQRT